MLHVKNTNVKKMDCQDVFPAFWNNPVLQFRQFSNENWIEVEIVEEFYQPQLICNNENPGKVNLAFRNNSGLERIFRPSAGLMWAVVTVSCSECEIMPSEPETHLLPEIVAQSRQFLLPGRRHSHPYRKWGWILMGVETTPSNGPTTVWYWRLKC